MERGEGLGLEGGGCGTYTLYAEYSFVCLFIYLHFIYISMTKAVFKNIVSKLTVSTNHEMCVLYYTIYVNCIINQHTKLST